MFLFHFAWCSGSNKQGVMLLLRLPTSAGALDRFFVARV